MVYLFGFPLLCVVLAVALAFVAGRFSNLLLNLLLSLLFDFLFWLDIYDFFFGVAAVVVAGRFHNYHPLFFFGFVFFLGLTCSTWSSSSSVGSGFSSS